MQLGDAQLAESARLLLSQAGHEFYEMAEQEHHDRDEFILEPARYERQLSFVITTASGAVVFAAGDKEFPIEFGVGEGFGLRVIKDQEWRTYSVFNSERTLQIHIGEPLAQRQKLVLDIVTRVGLPLIASLPLLALVIFYVVSCAMRPIQRIGQEVSRRTPSSLQPLSAEYAPREIVPLLDALNELFGRVSEAMEREKSFTADAAHELRTPLAALRAHAQVALQSENELERAHAIQQIMAGVERSSKLVAQLLTLARLEAATELRCKRVELRSLLETEFAELAPEGLAKGLQLSLVAPEPCVVQGEASLISILLRNLISNAIQYTPSQFEVTVRLCCKQGDCVVEVMNTGVEIPLSERKKIFQRFYRASNPSSTGSGLGLAIVQRIATLHRAKIEVFETKGQKGVAFRITFPMG